MRNILKILTLSVAAASVAGCAYGGLGTGYNSGYGYSPYGYGNSGLSVSVGYGSGYGYSPYGYGSGYGYGYGSPYYGGYYGSPYFGWYNSCYYPGSGIYVYDANPQPRVWTSAERKYWTGRRQAYESAAVRQGQRAPRIETNWSESRRDRAQSRAETGAAIGSNRIERARPNAGLARETARSTRTERVQRTQRTQRTERARDRRGRNSDD